MQVIDETIEVMGKAKREILALRFQLAANLEMLEFVTNELKAASKKDPSPFVRSAQQTVIEMAERAIEATKESL